MKISVIMPTYNSGKWIYQVVRSILNQKFKETLFDMELIIVDDCSTDGTYGYLKELQKEFPKEIILFKNEENKGLAFGVNLGLEIATGEWITIVDHDDLWDRDRIYAIWDQIEKDFFPIITAGHRVQTNKGITPKVRKNKNGEIVYNTNKTFQNLLRREPQSKLQYIKALLFKRHLISHAGKFKTDIDWKINLFYAQPSVEVCKTVFTRIENGKNLGQNVKYREWFLKMSKFTYEKWKKAGWGEDALIGYSRNHISLGKYYYSIGNMEMARIYFQKGIKMHKINKTLKNYLYYITTYIGGNIIRKYVKVHG